MSWLARSIANSLRIDDDEDDDDDADAPTTTSPNPNHSQSAHEHHKEDAIEEVEEEEDEEVEEDRSDNQRRGVKEDLSEFRETLTRQLWGVASFLAPPPSPRSHHGADRSVSDRNRWESSGQSGSGDVSDEDASESVGDSGIRNDFVDIEGKCTTGITNFSNFRPFGSDDQIGAAVGITDEVLAFARNIAHHPETWLDFPLSEEEDMDDFDMSDAQHKHVLAVERLAPRLAALRYELCPVHMSGGYFWKVYFVLLHSRLNKHDAEVLSTPQIVAARAMWMQELQKRTKPEADWFGRSTFYSKESANSLLEDFDSTSSYDSPSGNMSHRRFYSATSEFETEKHPVVSTEIKIIDKSVIEEESVIKIRDKEFVAGPSYKVPIQEYDDDGDDWLEENSELDGYSGTTILVGNEEDVSFSDLEDDDCTMPIKSKIASTKTS